MGLRLLWEKPGNLVSGFRRGTASALQRDPFWALPQGHIPDMAGAGVRSPAVCFMLTGRRQACPWLGLRGKEGSGHEPGCAKPWLSHMGPSTSSSRPS